MYVLTPDRAVPAHRGEQLQLPRLPPQDGRQDQVLEQALVRVRQEQEDAGLLRGQGRGQQC